MTRMEVISSHHGKDAVGEDIAANLLHGARSWCFTKDEIDNHSPSRKDGMDRMWESSLRKSYCSFLKDLGMKLRVSPVTTATSMMFCHRFYMRQSHIKNDWQAIVSILVKLRTNTRVPYIMITKDLLLNCKITLVMNKKGNNKKLAIATSRKSKPKLEITTIDPRPNIMGEEANGNLHFEESPVVSPKVQVAVGQEKTNMKVHISTW